MPRLRTDQPGIALLVVMLVTMVMSAIAAGAALIGANTYLINEYDSQSSLLESVADAGLERGRARLNADPTLYSTAAPSALELGSAVYDASGDVIPGVSRTIYAMPLGGGMGEYGNFATLVAIAEDGSGARAVRRLDLLQESFAIYAYFTNVEPSTLAFGNADQLYGPVHSNSDIRISSGGATFHGPVTTAGQFVGAGNATFLEDTTSGVTPVPMPTTGQLEQLQSRAEPANLSFTAASGGNVGQSTMRIHFVSRDVDGDGVEEGFIRVYRSPNAAWVTGSVSSGLGATPNCGHQHANGMFYRADNATDPHHNAEGVLTTFSPRCYLGGADEWHAHPSAKDGQFAATDEFGAWESWPGSVHPSVAGQPDAGFLFPIDRRLNPAFRGVIFVDGKVVVSGTVRGRLTLAASDNIIIGDDLVYENDPSENTCEDMLGLFSGSNVIVADNALNAPQQPPGSTSYRTYDDTPDENIHASILALNQFTVQNPGSGSTSAEACNGVPWGRGCLNVTGGLIQDTRGIVAYGSGTGNIKRYTHDTCAFTAPPPYFPSTGHFYRGRYYEVDPTGFSISEYFDALN